MTSSKTCSNNNLHCFFVIALFVLGSNFSANNVIAGAIHKSYVDYDGEEYHLNLIMQINAPATTVWRHLTNYNHLKKVNPVVTQSQIIKRGRTTRVKVISEGCIWFFCRTITQLQDIRDLGQGYLVITDVAGQSDFSSGHTLWHVIPYQKGTQVTIRSRMKPDFWIPPLIGPWLFKDALLQQAAVVINNLEHLSAPPKSNSEVVQ